VNESDHAADSMAYAIRSGIGNIVPSRRKIMDWLVPPTLYCFMLLFVTLTLYEVMSKLIEGMAYVSQGLLIQ
jgi:hypothetical protein